MALTWGFVADVYLLKLLANSLDACLLERNVAEKDVDLFWAYISITIKVKSTQIKTMVSIRLKMISV